MTHVIRLCEVNGCERKHKGHGYCLNHLRRWKKYGDPNAKHPKFTKKFCSIESCADYAVARGLCNKHWKRWRAFGDPIAGNDRFETPEESLARRVQRQGECLAWTGYKTSEGYGRLNVNGRLILSHRFAWESAHGEIPEGMEVDHTCWNPSCVNVDHLRLAAPPQNSYNRNGARADMTSGVRNVYRNGDAWIVKIGKDYKNHYFGRYPTIEEASAVAEQARKDLFGDFAGRG